MMTENYQIEIWSICLGASSRNGKWRIICFNSGK